VWGGGARGGIGEAPAGLVHLPGLKDKNL